jgi:hypothetical protein
MPDETYEPGVISFDFDDDNEFSNFLPVCVVEGEIQEAKVVDRSKDDPSFGEKYSLKVQLYKVPEWGDTIKFVNLPIAEKPVIDPDTKEQVSGDNPWSFNMHSSNLKNFFKIAFGSKVADLNGLNHSQVCEMLEGKILTWEVKEVRTSKAGNDYQVIEAVEPEEV